MRAARWAGTGAFATTRESSKTARRRRRRYDGTLGRAALAHPALPVRQNCGRDDQQIAPWSERCFFPQPCQDGKCCSGFVSSPRGLTRRMPSKVFPMSTLFHNGMTTPHAATSPRAPAAPPSSSVSGPPGSYRRQYQHLTGVFPTPACASRQETTPPPRSHPVCLQAHRGFVPSSNEPPAHNSPQEAERVRFSSSLRSSDTKTCR